jgi:hypothetical protein
VQVEYEFFAARDATEKKIKEKRKKSGRKPCGRSNAHESDEVAMARYREEHPEEIHADDEFFVVRYAVKRKKSEVKNEDDATPLMVTEEEEDDPFYMDIDWDNLARSDGSKII